eukprot:gene3559-4004_t
MVHHYAVVDTQVIDSEEEAALEAFLNDLRGSAERPTWDAATDAVLESSIEDILGAHFPELCKPLPKAAVLPTAVLPADLHLLREAPPRVDPAPVTADAPPSAGCRDSTPSIGFSGDGLTELAARVRPAPAPAPAPAPTLALAPARQPPPVALPQATPTFSELGSPSPDLLPTLPSIPLDTAALAEGQARAAQVEADEAKARAAAESQAQAQAAAEAKAQAEADAKAAAKTQAEAAAAKAHVEAQAKAKAEAKAQAEAEAQAKAEAQVEAQAQAKAKAEPEAAAQTKASAPFSPLFGPGGAPQAPP